MAACDFSEVKTGDIILKQGRGRVSRMIIDYFNEKVPLSHCGIIIKSDDSTFIVHSVAEQYGRKDGVQSILLQDFLKDCEPGYLYITRFKADTSLIRNFANKALYYNTQSIPFDENADNENPDRMSCTELINWCTTTTMGKSYMTSMNFAGKQVFTFAGLLDTNNFTIIKHY